MLATLDQLALGGEAHSVSQIPLSADALSDDSQYKELSNWIQCHRLAGCAAECDGLEDPQYTRTIGNASRLASGLPGRVGGKLQDQASSGAACRGLYSKGHPRVFKKLLPLRLRKTEYEPGEARQQRISVSIL